MEKVKSEEILKHIMSFYAHVSHFKDNQFYGEDELEKMKLTELQFDSLDVVELSLHIEEKYGLSMSEEEDEKLYDMSCVDIANMINEKLFGDHNG